MCLVYAQLAQKILDCLQSRAGAGAAQYEMHVALPAFTVNNQSSEKGFFVPYERKATKGLHGKKIT